MEDLDTQLARRDRMMGHRWAAMTIAERYEQVFRVQQKAWELLRSSPEGYAHFLRRNFKARAIKDGGGSVS